MPLFTIHYGLGIRLAGEPYLAAIDFSRFTTIDNEIAFLCDFIGDGRITGWHLSLPNGNGTNVVRVDQGVGLIDRFTTRTFGPLDVTLSEGGSYYFFLQRDVNVIGGFSDFSSLATVAYTDTSPPLAASSASITATSFNSLSLGWAASVSPDVAGYRVYRSIDNTMSGWSAITNPLGVTTSTSFTDLALSPSTLYYYRIVAFDQSGNPSATVSNWSTATYLPISGTTSADTRVPADPISILGFPGNIAFQVAWLKSPSSFVNHYLVTVAELNADGSDAGNSQSFTTSATSLTVNLLNSDPLTNNTQYLVTVQSVGTNSITSAGIQTTLVPQFNSGPNEVQSVSISDTAFGVSGVQLAISWVPATDQTGLFYYSVTLTENSSVFSDPVIVPKGTTTLSQNLFVQTANGLKTSHSILEGTAYSVRVQGISSTGVANIGLIQQLVTSKFSKPSSPVNASLQISENQYLEAVWQNGGDDFLYNTITIHDGASVVVNALNVGKSQSYLLSTLVVQLNHTYSVSIASFDSFGNECVTPAVASVSISNSLPVVPSAAVQARSMTGSIRLLWQQPRLVPNVQNYKVYRAVRTIGFSMSDFALIDTLGPTTTSFDDFAVDTSLSYAYIVATVDTFGNESAGPGTGKFTTNITYASALPNEEISKPTNVVVTASGYNVTVTWDTATDYFDGYQIYRAVSAPHDFVLVGAVNRGTESFTDSNVLLASGSYYYLVRKFRNEGTVFVSSNSALPPHSIVLGEITAGGNGNIFIAPDESLCVELTGLVDPITDIEQPRIKAHHHVYNSDSDDRRINLSSAWLVTDWTSLNQFTYTTKSDISTTTSESVSVNGLQTLLVYYIDRVAGTVTFESRLNITDVVTVTFPGIDEVQNVLPASRVGNLLAANFSSDTFDLNTLPTVDHRGRMGNVLLPQRASTITSDFLRYTILGGFAALGLTFFDIIATDDDGNLLAATSQGIVISNDFGMSWVNVLATPLPATRVFKANSNVFFCLAGNQVFKASSLLTDWLEYSGMEDIGVARDICEDGEGYIFVASDLGVYMLNTDIVDVKWVQTSIIKYRTTDCFSITYQPFGPGNLVVSTDIGLYLSTDKGNSWNRWTAFAPAEPVYQLLTVDDSAGTTGQVWMLALTDSELYITSANNVFTRVTGFLSPARKMTIWNTRCYVSTDNGILTSTGNILIAAQMGFDNILPQLAEGNVNYVITSLSAVSLPSSRLFLGMDQRVYSSGSHGSAALQFEDINVTSPSVYVNNVPVYLGVSYNKGYLSFSERLGLDDVVEVATQYSSFYIDGGGWADIAYACPVAVYANGAAVNDPSSTVQESDPLLGSLELPTLTSRNSTIAEAQPILAQLQLALTNVSNAFSQATVTPVLTLVDQLRSVIDESEIISVPPITSTLADPTRLDSLVCIVDSVNATFNFLPSLTPAHSQYAFWKFTDLTVDLLGTSLLNSGSFTHDELEDAFETYRSGMPSKLAIVHHVNQVKQGIWSEKTTPGGQAAYFPLQQADFFANCNFDWYDKLNSTVDFRLRIKQENKGVALQYPSAVLYVPDDANGDLLWVGGLGGIVALTTDISDQIIVTSVWSTPFFVKAMERNGDLVYVVTDNGLFSIDVTDAAHPAVQDNGFGFPAVATSLVVLYNNLVVGASDGIYVKGTNNGWTNVFSAPNVVVVNLGDLAFAYDSNLNVYSSPSGFGWTRKGSTIYDAITIKVIKYNSVLMATDAGLYDDNSTFYSQNVQWKLVNIASSSVDSDSQIAVNDVATDGSILVAGANTEDGAPTSIYYTYVPNTNTWTPTDVTDDLGTIHKMAIVNGDIWLFGYDKVLVKSVSGPVPIVKLATGDRLSWL